MKPKTEYMDDARKLDRGAFVMKYRTLFLVKHAVVGANPRRVPYSARTDFVTQTREVSFDPVPEELRIVALQPKTASGPMFVGRDAECDIVLRYPFVSKRHAQISMQTDGSLVLVDTGSSNGTFCNDRPLAPGKPHSVRPGETVGFGALRMELCDADRLHALLIAA